MTVDPQSVPAAPGPSARERLTWYATTARLASSKHNTQPWRFVVRRHVLDVEADRSLDRVLAGEALMAVLLATTVAGGSASYLNAALELPHTRALLRADLALDGHPQVVLRLGVGWSVDATPRRDPGDVVAHADEDESPDAAT